MDLFHLLLFFLFVWLLDFDLEVEVGVEVGAATQLEACNGERAGELADRWAVSSGKQASTGR